VHSQVFNNRRVVKVMDEELNINYQTHTHTHRHTDTHTHTLAHMLTVQEMCYTRLLTSYSDFYLCLE